MKKTLLTLLTTSLLVGGSTSTFAIEWPEADKVVAEASRQGVIKKQLTELRSSVGVGAELRNNMLFIYLKEDNQVKLALALAKSPELLAYYEVELTYRAPFSSDHLPLLQCINKLVQIKFENKILDVEKGKILSNIFSQHPTLTNLCFDGYNLTDDGLITIQQSMSSLPSLKTLSLRKQKNSLKDNRLFTLSNILPNLISLEELYLDEIDISKRETQFFSHFSKLINLRKLNLCNCNLVGDLFVHLKSLPNLTELNVGSNEITGKKLRAFLKFKSRKRLKILNISRNGIDDEGVAYISTLPNLTTLQVSQNNITDEGVNELTDLKYLERLDIMNNEVSEERLLAFAQNTKIPYIDVYCGYGRKLLEVLRNDSTVQSLNLLGCNKPSNAVLQALLKNTPLTSLALTIDNYYVGDNRIQTFAQKTNLTSLTLKFSKIDSIGAKVFANNLNLIELNLCNNDIGNSGAQAFAYNSTLKRLDLSWNNIGNQGAFALALNSTLIELNLCANAFGLASAVALIKNKNFRKLNIEDNNQINKDEEYVISMRQSDLTTYRQIENLRGDPAYYYRQVQRGGGLLTTIRELP